MFRQIFCILLSLHAFSMAASSFSSIKAYPRQEIGVLSIAFNKDTLWLGTLKGLIWIDTATQHSGLITPTAGLPFLDISNLSVGKNSTLVAHGRVDEYYATSRRESSGWNNVFPSSIGSDRIGHGVEHSSGTRFYSSYSNVYREDPDGTITTFPLTSAPAYGGYLHLTNEDTAVWFGGQRTGLCRLTRSMKCYRDDFPGTEPRAISGGNGRPLYALIENSVLKRYNSNTDRFDSIWDFEIRNDLFVDYRDQIWVGNTEALYRFKDGKETLISSQANSDWLFAEDSLHRLWVENRQKVYRVEGDTLKLILTLNFPLPSKDYTFGVAPDSQGIPWYGSTYYTGNEWIEDTRFTNSAWFSKAGLHYDITYPLSDSHNCSDARHFDGSKFHSETGCTPCHFLELDNGKLLGADGLKSICEWDGVSWKPLFTDTVTDFDLRSQFTEMLKLSDGSFLSGLFKDGAKIFSLSPTGVPSRKALIPGYTSYSACLDSTGLLWFSDRYTVYRFDGDTIVDATPTLPVWAQNPKKITTFGGLHVEPKGHILLSSSIGVFERDLAGNWTFYDGNDGVCEYGGRFFDAGHGEVMLTGNSCITRFATTEGEAFYSSLVLPSNYPNTQTPPTQIHNQIPTQKSFGGTTKNRWWDLMGRNRISSK